MLFVAANVTVSMICVQIINKLLKASHCKQTKGSYGKNYTKCLRSLQTINSSIFKIRSKQQRTRSARPDFICRDIKQQAVITRWYANIINCQQQLPEQMAPSVYTVNFVWNSQSNSSMHHYECILLCRHQSAERPILHQISSLMYPKIQRRQVIMNVLLPNCAWPARWSPPVLWRRFGDHVASIFGFQ